MAAKVTKGVSSSESLFAFLRCLVGQEPATGAWGPVQCMTPSLLGGS